MRTIHSLKILGYNYPVMHHHIKEEWDLKFNKLLNILFPKKLNNGLVTHNHKGISHATSEKFIAE